MRDEKGKLISLEDEEDFVSPAPWSKNELKKLMTDVAKGKITMAEAEKTMIPKKKTQKRKLNPKGGKK